VQARYGVPAAHYADFAILRGDPSDGLPGVNGVGEKTARDLVSRHGAVADVVAAADTLTPKLRERILSHREYLTAMEQVVPVLRDAELVERRGTLDVERLTTLAKRHAIETPVQRLREALGV
jgi:5'-3' exonuclease